MILMSEKSLERKLRLRWLKEYIVAMKILFALAIIAAIQIMLIGLLFAPDALGDFLLSTLYILFSWAFLSMFWMVWRVVREKITAGRSVTVAVLFSGSGSIFFQIAAVYLLLTMNPQLFLVLFFIWIELFCYLGVVSISPMPGNRFTFWTAIFFTILIGGVIFTLSPAAETLSLLEIQIAGAFIGLLAAISIGEVFKAMNEYRMNVELGTLIINELVRIEKTLKPSYNKMVPTPVWSAAVSAGRILNLETKFREKATHAYSEIHYYNQTLYTENKDRVLDSIRNMVD
jgi:hypothetical protein